MIRSIEKGTYDPVPAYSVIVPKSRLTARPAALLSLPDRVIYEAIVAALTTRIERYLLGDGLVFWPRGTECSKRWDEFERSVITPDFEYVARADIAGFFECIDHEQLGNAIVSATGYRDLADALACFLERIMGSRRGLPQGLMPSDTLATLYLAELDFVMVRNGFRYVRHGDDVRIAAETYDRACRALRTLEATLRKLGLLLNVEKTRVLRRDTYARNVTARETIFDDAQERITSARVQNIRNNEHALETAIHDADMEQLGWDLFYHERIDLDAAIEELRPALTPTEVEVAEHVFLNAVENQPGTDHALERDTFHQRLAWSLVRLSAGRSHAGVVHVAPLMISYPEKVRMLCSYLSALASEQAFTTAVASQIEIALGVENTEWETALVVRVLRRMPMKASNNILSTLKSFLDSPHNRWLAAVEVAKLMAIRQELERDSLIQMWESCPLVLRADLVEAAAQMVRSAPWAKAFVESTRSDPIHEVVARHELHNE